MSTSATDYYKVSFFNEWHNDAKLNLDNAKANLLHAQEALARCREHVSNCNDDVDTSAGLLNDAQEELSAIEVRGGRQCDDEFHPHTGMKQGEKFSIVSGDGQMAYLTAISHARELMAQGRVQEAISAEKDATALLNKFEYALPSKSYFLPLNDSADTVQVCAAQFVGAKCIPESEEELMKSIEHAKDLYDDGILEDPTRLIRLLGGACFGPSNDGIFDEEHLLMGLLTGGVLGDSGSKFPEGVNQLILIDVFEQIRSLEKCNEKMVEVRNDAQHDRLENGWRDEHDAGSVGEDADEVSAGSHNEDEGDDISEMSDTQQSTFGMTQSCWEAVEKAVRSQISKRKESNVKELEVPDDSSSNIARYNPESHFRFASEEACSNVGCLFDSLINCKLRSRPANYSKENPEHCKLPFQLRTYNNSGFDVDGDLVVMCGDMYHNSVREEKNFVGFQRVPCPVNLENAKTLCELRDANDSNNPWDTNIVERVYKGGKRTTEWFENCISDSENSLVWAADSRSGTIHAFSTNDQYSNPKGAIAKLSFSPEEVKLKNRTGAGPYGIAKCGNTIVGTGMSGLLSTWNVSSALEESGDKTSKPHVMSVDHSKNFLCGDLQCMGDSQLLVAPMRIDFDEGDQSHTIRLYDINAETVAGLFCGTLGQVSIGKQYCVDSHSAIFAMSNSVGVVFDIRTYQPTIALHVEKARGEQILGVPTDSSAPVAFTYGSQEEIKCWDLRMPVSHAYTMATGNTIINHLLWHEDTSSLIASTRSTHIVSHGRCVTGYMYGDEISSDEEIMTQQHDYWPGRAIHNRSYFGYQWHCDCENSFAMLQYPFQNSRGMHESLARLKSG